jgi:SAM-dependent methyltransferase
MPADLTSFSELYTSVRQKEGRIYPDDIVARLPVVPNRDRHSTEWKARASSLRSLKAYLRRFRRPLRILDLGCGNGWLSQHLSGIPGTRVWGVDRNPLELAQAARVFSRANLLFLSTDILLPPFAGPDFDVVVLASVIQYFIDLLALIRRLQLLLRPNGEIHILDSPIYEEREVGAARTRTTAYYTELGFPEMADLYFHHTYAELQSFSPRLLYGPGSPRARFARLLGAANSPFPWLSISR